MHRKSYKPVKDINYIAWAQNIYRQCDANRVAWNLNTDDVEKLGLLVTEAMAAFEKNSNREIRNHQTVAYKNGCFSELDIFLTPFTYILKGTLTVPDADIEAMHLSPRKRRSYQPKPRPVKAPTLLVVNSAPGELTAYVSSEQHGHPASSLNDSGYAGFVLRYLVEGENEWREKASTRLRAVIRFEDAYRGKRLTCTALWFNARLERGPHSDEKQVFIN
ncbi:MAG: hypothetical protein LBT76_02905 [Tannerella sp.]|jgi:hypothetical protein|nr:hypothetical protein [Tannerella sp.]